MPSQAPEEPAPSSDITPSEGTIQFAYELTPAAGPPASAETIAELSAWRSILWSLGLLGQQPGLYGGFAYGNLSSLADGKDGGKDGGKDDSLGEFVITASQSSGSADLQPEHLVRVTHCNLQRFWIEASGSEPPSSESVTHAMIYAADAKLKYVFHVHSSEIWQQRQALGLPETSADVPYGSPAMAGAVNEVLQQHLSRPLVFATAGHADGIFALAHTARDCGGLLLSYLAKARVLLALQ